MGRVGIVRSESKVDFGATLAWAPRSREMIRTVSGLGRVKGLPGLRGVQVDRKQIQTH